MIATKIILRKLMGDYRKGHLSTWADYEGQPAQEIKKRMRQEIMSAMRLIRYEKKYNAKLTRAQLDAERNRDASGRRVE